MKVMRAITAPNRPNSKRIEAYSFWTISLGEPSPGKRENMAGPAEPIPAPKRVILGEESQVEIEKERRERRVVVDSEM